MLLVPEEVDFKISTTELEATYTESDGVRIQLTAQKIMDIKNRNYRLLELRFDTVAEMKCISLNFFETHWDSITIEPKVENWFSFWEARGFNPEPNIYQRLDADLLTEEKRKYDSRDRLNLKHYLIIGNDSYIEVVASGYEFEFID